MKHGLGRCSVTRSVWLAIVLLGCASTSAWAQLGEDSPARFLSADDAFRERGERARAVEAIEGYRAAWAAQPGDWEAAWRLSMASYFMGNRFARNDDEAESYFAEGRDAGIGGIALRADCAPCHFFTGVNMALYGETVGVLKMLFSLGDVRRHLKRSQELDPAFAFGAAPRVLGLIDQKLPRFLGGNKKRALGYFEQAVVIDSTEPLNFLYLAEFLDKVDRDPNAALLVVRRGMELPVPGPERVESIDALAELVEYEPILVQRVAQAAEQKSKKVRRTGIRKGGARRR